MLESLKLVIEIKKITSELKAFFKEVFTKYKFVNRVKHDKFEKFYQESNNLKYDTDEGVYTKTNADGIKETYCPICYEANHILIHIQKVNRNGYSYFCKNCNNRFGNGTSIHQSDNSLNLW